MSRSFSLSIKDLHQLTGTLSDVYFDKTKWFDLGLSLHLPETELKAIKDDCSSDSHKCLRECLCLWLKSAGSPQAQVLANALDDISIKPAAERINKICKHHSQNPKLMI
uniref:Death domain-containing protein n=1 Tax=Amphimedon queenslandica TaxID=400682 RepID=A0A1X7UR09_AMPQE